MIQLPPSPFQLNGPIDYIQHRRDQGPHEQKVGRFLVGRWHKLFDP